MRFFIVKNGANVVGKQVFSGEDAQINEAVAQFISTHPGLTVTELDQATFDATLLMPDPIPTRNDALNALAVGSTGQDKLTRAILLVILDEVNTIRAALSLGARTVNQFKSAVQAKLNSGVAD